MFSFSSKIQYYMCCWPVDIRKSFDGLHGVVLNYLKKDPLSGDVFVFLNKGKTHIKMLCWDGDGFVIIYKKLEKGTFDLLKSDTTSRTLKREELLMVLEGIRTANYKKKKRYLTAEKQQ